VARCAAWSSVRGHRRRFNPCDLSDWICRPNATPNLPLAIICFNEATQTWRIGYLDVVAPDGSATYVAGDLWATVNAKGLVQPPIAQQASTALARPWMTCALLAASWSSSALSKNQPNAIANELHHGRIVWITRLEKLP
jgi:hypothetical protein